MAFTTLYCINGRVLAFVDVINVKHYVGNINRKYKVTTAMIPPTVNIIIHIMTILIPTPYLKPGKAWYRILQNLCNTVRLRVKVGRASPGIHDSNGRLC